MRVNAKKVQSALLHQMEQYLDGKITKEEYTIATESFYSRYAYLIVDTQFYENLVLSPPHHLALPH